MGDVVRLPDLLDYDVPVTAVDDSFEVVVLVPRLHCEVVGHASDLLIFLKRELDQLEARVLPTLAHEFCEP